MHLQSLGKIQRVWGKIGNVAPLCKIGFRVLHKTMKKLRQDSVSNKFPFCAIIEGNKMILWEVGIVWQT